MLSSEIKVSRSDIPTIYIGRAKTRYTRIVVFDFSALTEEFGSGDFILLYSRPGELANRPEPEMAVPLEITGNKAVWKVSERDTENSGCGEGEIIFRNASCCYKTNVFPVIVNRAIC